MPISMLRDRCSALALLTVTAVTLSGCALGGLNTTPSAQEVSAAISGVARGGQQPISGATVRLWQTGTSGYGAGATQLKASTTTAIGSGQFNFPVGSVTCNSGTYAYVTVTGGDPTGNTTATTNSGIAEVAMLGPCSGISDSTFIVINEATTIAAAYSLGYFANDNSGTITIGAPGTNTQGLSDAQANALLLVGLNNGYGANGSTATMQLPTAMVNTLANVLAACVNTTSSAVTLSTACSSLYSLTTPPGGTAPTDVFQAAINMARYPGQNVSSLLSLASSTAPFQPSVSTSSVTTNSGTGTGPNDLSLGIAYPNTTQATAAGNSAVGMTVDNNDNVWVIGASTGTTTSTSNIISELTSASSTPTYMNTNGAINSPLDGSHTLRNARFDTAGNMWLTDKNSTAGGVIKLPASGSSVNLTSPTEYTFGITALDQNTYDLAVDANNNVFTASYGAQGNCTTGTSGTECFYVEFPATTYTPATTTFGGANQPAPTVRGMAADTTSAAGKGTIWTANYGIFGAATGGTTVEALNPSTGALGVITIGSTADSPFDIAMDASGGAYVDTVATASSSALYYVPQSTAFTGANTAGSGVNSTTPTGTVSSSVSTSGNGSGNTLQNIPTANTSTLGALATSPLNPGGLNGPGYMALDGNGNVFLANYNYGSIVEYAPSLNGYVSPYYGFSPNVNVPAQTLTVTAVTLGSSGTANVYYTGDTAINGQQVTFSGMTGNYAFLNGNTYTISSTSFNYFIIPDGGAAAVSKTTTSGTATIAATTQATFKCYNYVTTTSSVVCTTTGNAVSRNNGIGIDRAGTVWTLGTNGTLVGAIGLAAPTNPVLAAGQAGAKP